MDDNKLVSVWLKSQLLAYDEVASLSGSAQSLDNIAFEYLGCTDFDRDRDDILDMLADHIITKLDETDKLNILVMFAKQSTAMTSFIDKFKT